MFETLRLSTAADHSPLRVNTKVPLGKDMLVLVRNLDGAAASGVNRSNHVNYARSENRQVKSE